MAKHPTVAVALAGTVESLAAASTGPSDSSFDLAFVRGWATRMATRFAASAAAIAAAKRAEGGSPAAAVSSVFNGVAHLIRWMLWRAPSSLAEISSNQSASAFSWEHLANLCDAAAVDDDSGTLSEAKCSEVEALILAAGQVLTRHERTDAAWAQRNETELLRNASVIFSTLTTAGRDDLCGGPMHVPVSIQITVSNQYF